MTPASSTVRHTTTVSVVVVALVAAVVSYSHMQEVASDAGEHWRSGLIPLSIDGLVVAGSMVLLTRRRAGLPGGWLAWAALIAGVVASLAANMADAQPTTTARLIAAWPAAAFAVAFELLLQQRRAEQSGSSAVAVAVERLAGPAVDPGRPTDGTGSVVSPQPVEPVLTIPAVPTPEPVVVRQEPVVAATKPPVPLRQVAATPTPTAATKPALRRDKPARQTAEDRRAWVRQQRDKGISVTGADVHKQFPNGPRDGARIVRQVDAELDAELAAVAAGKR